MNTAAICTVRPVCARARRGRWAPACTILLLAGYLAVAATCGADLLAMPRFFLAAVFWLCLPGRTLAAALAPRHAPRGVYAAVYGCGLLAAVQCISARLGAYWLLFLLPPVVGLAGCVRRPLPWRQARRRLVFWLGHPRVMLWAGLCLAYALGCSAANPHPQQAGAAVLDRDFLWNIGNAAALSRHFPAEDMRFSGVRLAYHYLTELLSAALARVSAAPLYDVYFVFAGPVFLFGELLALRALARCCWPGDRRAERRVLALVFGFSCASMWKVLWDGQSLFGNTLLAHLVTNVSARAVALPFLAGTFCAFAALMRGKGRGGWRWWWALFVSFALLCVAKGPQAALLLCGVAAALALLVLLRRVRFLPALGCLAGMGATFAALYRFLYAAGVGSMEFSIFAMQETVVYRLLSPLTDRLCALLPGSGYFWLTAIGVCNVFCMLPFQCVLCLYALPAALRGLLRPDPARLLAAALAGGGMLAYHLFSHTSSSQIYFALLAMLCLSLLAAGALDHLPPCLPGRIPAILAGGAAALTTLCLAVSVAVQAAAPLGACLGLAAPPAGVSGSGTLVTAADEEAMRWLADNSAPDDVFATNRTSGTPEMIDAISNVYTAFSGRQAYLEGWTYAMTNMGVDPDTLGRQWWINDQLTGGTLPAAEARELAAQEGVAWLVLAKDWPGAPPAGMTPAYENEDVAIYRF